MRYIGSVYRTLDPRWAWAPLSGQGTSIFGERFSQIGTPALYTSLTYEGAMRERIGLARTQPVVTCQYDVDVEPVFNTFESNDLRSLNIQLSDLDCAWEDEVESGIVPKSHMVASQLMRLGYAGVLVKSFALAAAPNDFNLVLWEYSDKLPRKVSVVDDENLLERMRDMYPQTDHRLTSSSF